MACRAYRRDRLAALLELLEELRTDGQLVAAGQREQLALVAERGAHHHGRVAASRSQSCRHITRWAE